MKIFANINMAILTFLACLICLMGQSWAEESTFDIADATVISPSASGHSHYLLRPDISLPDTTMMIDRATLNLWVSPQTEDTTYISIRVYPISVDWSVETVSWESPWTNPGGDFDDANYAEHAMSLPGTQEIQIDLTDLCMRWADGRLPYNGFLIDISESSMAGVEFLNGENGNGPFGRLNISHSQILVE